MRQNVKKRAGQALLSTGLALAALGLASGTAHAFDPQPDPPAEPKITEVQQNPSHTQIGLDKGRVRVSSSSGYVTAQHR
jgi:hypothetical protein